MSSLPSFQPVDSSVALVSAALHILGIFVKFRGIAVFELSDFLDWSCPTRFLLNLLCCSKPAKSSSFQLY